MFFLTVLQVGTSFCSRLYIPTGGPIRRSLTGCIPSNRPNSLSTTGPRPTITNAHVLDIDIVPRDATHVPRPYTPTIARSRIPIRRDIPGQLETKCSCGSCKEIWIYGYNPSYLPPRLGYIVSHWGGLVSLCALALHRSCDPQTLINGMGDTAPTAPAAFRAMSYGPLSQGMFEPRLNHTSGSPLTDPLCSSPVGHEDR